MLAHHPEIDTISIGESETTFLELVGRLQAGQPTHGLAGAAYRVGDRIELGPKRASIEDLDSLASPHDWFDTHIVMTSRGCPWACTFCGAETSWGRSSASRRSKAQAEARSGGAHGNKGYDSALAALEMVDLFSRLDHAHDEPGDDGTS